MAGSNKRKIYVILGPTSSGKTSLALKLCAKFGGEILSADSRQVVKHMDIGTGKMPISSSYKIFKDKNHWNVNGVNIWGYDLINPNDYFSAYDFAEFGLEILKRGEKTFVVGGTGFYIDVLTGNVVLDSIKPDFERRNELEQLSLEDLQLKLKDRNLEKFESMDTSNKVRLLRAIEIEEKPEDIDSSDLKYLKDAEFIYIGLTTGREVLYERVDMWVDEIWDDLQLEIERLDESKYKDSEKLNGLIYKTAKLENKQQTKYDLHAYIRRQQTYFKKMEKTVKINWFDISDPDLYSKIESFLR